MAKSLNDDQPLSTYINDDDQTIHLLVKAQPTNPPEQNTQPQAQPQAQPTQQSNTNTQQNPNPTSANQNFMPLNIGDLLNNFLGRLNVNVPGQGKPNIENKS